MHAFGAKACKDIEARFPSVAFAVTSVIEEAAAVELRPIAAADAHKRAAQILKSPAPLTTDGHETAELVWLLSAVHKAGLMSDVSADRTTCVSALHGDLATCVWTLLAGMCSALSAKLSAAQQQAAAGRDAMVRAAAADCVSGVALLVADQVGDKQVKADVRMACFTVWLLLSTYRKYEAAPESNASVKKRLGGLMQHMKQRMAGHDLWADGPVQLVPRAVGAPSSSASASSSKPKQKKQGKNKAPTPAQTGPPRGRGSRSRSPSPQPTSPIHLPDLDHHSTDDDVDDPNKPFTLALADDFGQVPPLDLIPMDDRWISAVAEKYGYHLEKLKDRSIWLQDKQDNVEAPPASGVKEQGESENKMFIIHHPTDRRIHATITAQNSGGFHVKVESDDGGPAVSRFLTAQGKLRAVKIDGAGWVAPGAMQPWHKTITHKQKAFVNKVVKVLECAKTTAAPDCMDALLEERRQQRRKRWLHKAKVEKANKRADAQLVAQLAAHLAVNHA